MEKTKQEVYNKIDNELYNAESDIWWQPNTTLHLLKTSVNPWRVSYASGNLKKLGIDPNGKTALEVGCGGGILTEEICKMGFITTGIDPSEQSLRTAINHAKILEHVNDLPKVISEISRVLKPEGVFFYDTLNRTFISKLVAIKIWQEWKRWAFMPPNLHVWKMFIKPYEIKGLLSQNGFEWREHKGSQPNVSIPKMLSFLRKRAKGEWTYADLGKNFWLVESNDMNILYAGYALKK